MPGVTHMNTRKPYQQAPEVPLLSCVTGSMRVKDKRDPVRNGRPCHQLRGSPHPEVLPLVSFCLSPLISSLAPLSWAGVRLTPLPKSHGSPDPAAWVPAGPAGHPGRGDRHGGGGVRRVLPRFGRGRRTAHHKRVWSLLPWQLLAGRGGLGRAGPRGGRVHEALVYHPEAELLAGVHVQVVRPLLRLVLPHPHLLCFVAGQGAGSRQQPGRRGALRLGVPPKAPTPRKPNPKPSLLCLQSHRNRPGPGAGGQAGSGQPRAHREQPEDCSAGTQAGPTCGWHNATQQRGARAEPSWPLNVE